MSTLPSSPAKARPVVTWAWSAVWAALFTGVLLLTANTASDGCWFYRDPKSVVFVMAAILWLWLFVFFCLRNRGRMVLIAFTLLVCALGYAARPNVLRGGIAAEEAGAAPHIHALIAIVQGRASSARLS